MSKCLKKFEYTRIYCEVDHNELDMMGEAGWELVAIELSKSVGLPTLWFKREKQETVEVRNDITISCDRDPILNEINAIMRNSNDILNSVEKHKSILEDCENIVKDLNPVLAVDKSRDEKIANLEKSVSGINDSIEGLKELILGLNKKE